MKKRGWKDEEAECKGCSTTLRRGAYTEGVWETKLCPRCFTLKMTVGTTGKMITDLDILRRLERIFPGVYADKIREIEALEDNNG